MNVEADLANQLYRLLPGVFRTRDNPTLDTNGGVLEPGDLAQWLSAQGTLLDRVHRTLVQMLYDHFPDEAGDDANGTPRSCQPWLLPYFAQLLDVSLVSPEVEGQRAEVANAVVWRQRKGTLPCVEDIARQVGQLEVEIQEGWQRVAVTPRVGDPLLPATALGEAHDLNMNTLPPTRRALHPGLPAATIDFRQLSRAVQCDPSNPAAHTTVFAGMPVSWRRIHPHGAPCLPGSYQDSSRRVPDLRDPAWNRGQFHPRRLLLFFPPPDGFFSRTASSVLWTDIQAESNFGNSLIQIHTDTSSFHGATVPRVRYVGLTPDPLRIKGPITLAADAVYHFENVWLDSNLDVTHGKAEFVGCAVHKITVHAAGVNEPALDAQDTLIRTLLVSKALARLEYVTVLHELVAQALQASDCILLPDLHKDLSGTAPPASGCLRYSRLPAQTFPLSLSLLQSSNTDAPPWFFSTQFGQPGCGVLHPGADPALLSGAEDGGEMGAYHDRRYVLRQQAIVDKLADYLPVGLTPVLIPDTTLSCPPPRAV